MRNSSSEQTTGSSLPATLPAVGVLIGLAASTASSDGAVFFTDVTSGGTISAGSSLYFDLGEGGGGGSWSIAASAPAGADFRLYFGSLFPYGGPSSSKPRIANTSGNNTIAVQGNYVAQLGAGTTIDSSLTWSSFGHINRYDYQGSWSPGTEAYVGLRLGSGATAVYGWADIEYNSSRQLTLHGFAVETTPGTSIQAAAVPEPEETALVMAVVAGSAALYRRRQQVRRSQVAEGEASQT